jgi:esterase/lipase superfamily enzyme
LSQRSGARKIHLIAHSMGNRAVCDALERVSFKLASSTPLLHHLVLTAPDIDADTFRQMAVAIRSNAHRVTLYASSSDKAMVLSRKLHGGKKRAGEPIVVHSALDAIDASSVNTDFLTHGYFAQDRSVLEDIHALFEADAPPSGRFQLRSVTDQNGSYYAFRE